MEFLREKGVATAIFFPILDPLNPELYAPGLTVVDTPYYLDLSDSNPVPQSHTITDTVTEIGSTGMYWLWLTGAEMNHDFVLLKLEDGTSSSAGSDNMIVINCTRPAFEDSAQEASSVDHTYGDLLRVGAAVLAGESSGGGVAGQIVFRDLGDTKDRVVANVDANGNRNSVPTVDGT
jgi:hypothetical protein